MKIKYRLFNSLSTLVLTLFIIEGLLRVILAIRVSPDLILYGTPYQITNLSKDWQGGISEEEYFNQRHNVAYHDNDQENYSKYHPHEQLKETSKDGILFDVRINNHGFRGADYEWTKPPGVLRVACLGDSSTFGYGDRDDETYPAYLEVFLNARLQELEEDAFQRVEVFNFGVPHMLAENMYHIFVKEVLPLSPDVVTLYAGMFDAAKEVDNFDRQSAVRGDVPKRLRRERRRLLMERATGKFLFLRLIDSYVPLNKAPGFDRIFYEKYLEKDPGKEYVMWLGRIRAECRRRGIAFYVLTQQSQSNMLEEDEIEGVTFAEEVRAVQAKLKRRKVTRHEMYFLAHNHYDHRMRMWASEQGVTLLDARAALDAYRHYLWHWVHIIPEGNQILAETIGRQILEDF
ncbi:MAG: SGNH/GDSL hydrolase family protein [Candidatus Omnitrophica bacterium]|nr:SGNH/GDSL hydrolase family protein [Candidatus Omnitrophota bacterium]